MVHFRNIAGQLLVSYSTFISWDEIHATCELICHEKDIDEMEVNFDHARYLYNNNHKTFSRI